MLDRHDWLTPWVMMKNFSLRKGTDNLFSLLQQKAHGSECNYGMVMGETPQNIYNKNFQSKAIMKSYTHNACRKQWEVGVRAVHVSARQFSADACTLRACAAAQHVPLVAAKVQPLFSVQCPFYLVSSTE